MDLPCHSSSSLSLCFPILPSLQCFLFPFLLLSLYSLLMPLPSFLPRWFHLRIYMYHFFYCFVSSPNTFVFVYFQMFNAIKQGVVHSLQQPPPDIEALRVYLLLPEFSIYQKEEQYDAIVIPFGEAILRLSVDAGKVLSEYEEPYASFAPTKYA